MIKFNVHKTSIRTIRSNDHDFHINDGLTVSPRAGFEIEQICPREYRMIILECIERGWLKPVAHLYDYERVYETLKY